jgi:hypothetical protein
MSGGVHQCGCWLSSFVVVGFFYDLVLMFRLCVWPMSMWCVFLYSHGLNLCGECVMPTRRFAWVCGNLIVSFLVSAN